MTDLYVRKTGNDTTGNGSTGNPYLTIDRALNGAAPKLAAGATLWVGDGAYVESSGGNGYLTTPAYVSLTTIRSESGNPNNVTISGVDSLSNININHVGGYVKFQDVSLLGAVGKGASVHIIGSNLSFQNCKIIGNSGIGVAMSPPAGHQTNITFTDCVFSEIGTGAVSVYAVPTVGRHSTGVTFTRCTFTGASDRYVLNIGNGTAADVVNYSFIDCSVTSSATTKQPIYANAFTNLTFTTCTVLANAYDGAFFIQGINLTITGGYWYSASSYHALSIGSDAVTAVTVTGTMIGGTVTCTTGHALLVGYGANNFLVDQVKLVSGNYALVIKHCDGVEVKNCNINATVADDIAAVYFKAATNANVHNNTIYCSYGNAILLTKGDADAKCQNITFRYNKVLVSGTASLFSWGNDTHDLGGGIVDYNQYRASAWGTVRGTAVTNIDTLRAAWAGYGGGSNDSHSQLWTDDTWMLFRTIRHR